SGGPARRRHGGVPGGRPGSALAGGAQGHPLEAPVAAQVLGAVFAEPDSALPAVGRVVADSGDRVVYVLSRVHDGDGKGIGEEERRSLRRSLEQMQVSREWRAYEDSLLAAAEIAR